MPGADAPWMPGHVNQSVPRLPHSHFVREVICPLWQRRRVLRMEEEGAVHTDRTATVPCKPRTDVDNAREEVEGGALEDRKQDVSEQEGEPLVWQQQQQ